MKKNLGKYNEVVYSKTIAKQTLTFGGSCCGSVVLSTLGKQNSHQCYEHREPVIDCCSPLIPLPVYTTTH